MSYIIRDDGNIKHTAIYHVWKGIISRCTNVNIRHSDYYVNRGITVCDDWRGDFGVFYNWAMNNGYAKGLEIDRRNNNEGYSPENCRWVTRSINNQNKRSGRVNSIGYIGVSKKNTASGVRFYAKIMAFGITYSLGGFDDPIMAAKAYNDFVIKNEFSHTLNENL